MDKKEKEIEDKSTSVPQAELIGYYHNRNIQFRHLDYTVEQDFYNIVGTGQVEELERRNPQLLVEGQGLLSKNPIVNMRCHLIIAIALITRSCILNGMPQEEAYNLSDTFIRKANSLEEEEDLKALHHEMTFTFARLCKR